MLTHRKEMIADDFFFSPSISFLLDFQSGSQLYALAHVFIFFLFRTILVVRPLL